MKRRGFLAGALVLAATAARGHSFYDPLCCNGQDCAPVPDGAVRATRAGWAVTLRPGDHPEITKPLSAVVPFAEARPAEDGRFHVCIWPRDTLRCLYVPPGGV